MNSGLYNQLFLIIFMFLCKPKEVVLLLSLTNVVQLFHNNIYFESLNGRCIFILAFLFQKPKEVVLVPKPNQCATVSLRWPHKIYFESLNGHCIFILADSMMRGFYESLLITN